MSEKSNELFILTQKAQKMERINEEVALNIYLEIFENYTPKISKTYDSAIRLLEKRNRCQEALAICNQAIELIHAQEVSGVVSRFESIQDRLERKLAEQGKEIGPEPKKAYTFKPIHLAVPLAIVLLFFIILRFTSPYDELSVDLEGKESLEGGLGSLFDPEETDTIEIDYPVTDEMIQLATDEITKNIDVKDAGIIPQRDTLGIAIIVAPGTSEARSKELAVLYLKALAGAASATYPDLAPPKEDTLGDLYSHYDLVITVGLSNDEEDFTAKGSKNKPSKELYWRKLN